MWLNTRLGKNTPRPENATSPSNTPDVQRVFTATGTPPPPQSICQEINVAGDMRCPQDEVCTDATLIRGIDQGALAPGHARFTMDFIDEHFLENKRFCPQKIEDFIAQLVHQRETISADLRETAISEKMQTDTQTLLKAREKGDIRGLEGNADVLMGFDQFILPLAREIHQLVQVHNAAAFPTRQAELESQNKILGCIHEFIRGYAPYYSPNKIRTYFKNDTEISGIVKQALLPHKIKKHDPNALEASNLVVDAHLQAEIEHILDRALPIGQYLSPTDIAKLKAAEFDLSRLMPGVSAFWERPDPEAFLATVAEEQKLFPTSSEKLTYKGPRYRSWVSTKMSASFERDGKKHLIKIKLGAETHSDILASYLRRAMGFFQDRMQHREHLTLHLGAATYQEFERDIGIKYGINTLKQAIARRGTDPDTGEEWVTFKSAALELRPDTDIRATTVDAAVYDGVNRRELRARRLVRAFLGLTDIKPTNHRLVFEALPNGRHRPTIRFQDPGSSIGSTVVLQRPRDLLRFPVTKNKIEEYDRDYVRKNKKGDVTVIYNDGFFHTRDDASATYADFKWMARVIGALPDNLIKAAIDHAGIPENLQSVYFYHIGNMKNRALKAFDLSESNEANRSALPLTESKIGVLKNINVPGVIKKGRITATHVPDRVMLPKLQQTWFTFLNSMGGLTEQGFTKNIQRKFDLEYQGIINGIVKNQARITGTILREKVPETIATFTLAPGVSVSVYRVVAPNATHFNAEGKGRPYLVTDTLSVTIGAEASLFLELASALTPEVAAKCKCLTLNLTHTHFSETVLSGYQKGIGIHKLLFGNIDRYALEKLGPGEAIKKHWSAGLDANITGFATATVPAIGLFSARAGASASLTWLKAGELTYAKDTWGSLHLIQEKLNQRGMDVNVDLGNIDIKQLSGSLCKQRFTTSRLHQSYTDIEVTPPEYNQENGEKAITGYDVNEATQWLGKLRNSPELITNTALLSEPESEIPEYIQLHYAIDAQRVAHSRGNQFLYVFDRSKSINHVDFNTVSRNHAYRFHKITRAKKGLAGIEELAVDFNMHNLLVKQGTSKKLTLEMDRDNPKKFVGILDIYDYKRTMSREQLIDFIQTLNARYSANEDSPFFRTDLLPSDEQYKKIYANGRIYIDGGALLDRLDTLGEAGFTAAVQAAYKKVMANGNGSRIQRAGATIDKHRIATEATVLAKKLAKTATKFSDHYARRGTAFDDGRDPQKMENALATAVFDFIYKLYKSKFGIPLLQAVLGKESMLVIGEIYGIHQQTGMLHDDMWKSTLRFMGTSHGEAMKHTRAPIQHYIRHEQFQPPSDLARPRIEIEHFLGPTAKGLSGEDVGLGNR